MKRLNYREEYETALADATRLAWVLYELHWSQRGSDWKPLPTLRGVISQIDNLTAGLVRRGRLLDARGMSASGRDPKGLEAKPASPVGNADAPKPSPETNHA